MLYDEALAIEVADAMLERGIYVTGFCFPSSPRARASACALRGAPPEDIERAIEAFIDVREQIGFG